MSQFQRQEKQKYLRQNILEKQYDAEQFMDFCQNYKGSADIDSWTLSELQEIVNRFVKQEQAKNDQFSGFQQPSPLSQTKQQVFDHWSDFVSHVSKPEQKKQLGLNPIDLDFLQMMGMSSPAVSKQQPFSQPTPRLQFGGIASNLQKPKPKDPNQQFVKNMQNQNFISVFNLPTFNTANNNQNNPFIQLQKTTQIKPVPFISPQKQSASVKNINTTNNNNLHQRNSLTPESFPKPQKQCQSTVGAQDTLVCEIKCHKISKNKLPPDNMICSITGYQIINPNVFVPKYVLYTVSTFPFNVEVKRRMKDFQQLRDLLKKMFPTTQIPHLQRYSRLSQTESNVIQKQKLYLQSFLNSLVMNPVLKCKIFQDFLLCTDLDLLKNKFRDFQKIQKPKGIQNLWTLTGYGKLDTNTASRKYMNQQNLYIDYVYNSLAKLKGLYDHLMVYYANTAKIISQISQVYEQLRQTTKTVNQAFHQSLRFKTFEPILGSVAHIHKQLGESMQIQAKNIHTQLKQMFKYQVQNVSTIRQTLKTLSNIHEAYEKRNDKETAKKQVYQNKKLNEYKNAVAVPSKNITVLKYQSAYAQNQFRDQICRYMEELSARIGARFQIFSTLQMSIAADMDIVWRQFQKQVENRKAMPLK